VPDQPEASHRLAGQRPYVEPFQGATPAGESSANARLPQRNLSGSGLPGWLAVLLLIGIAGVGGLIDSISGSAIRGAFNYSLVFASLIAILVVRRSQMFNVVIAPPLVYFAASAGLLYVRTGGLHNRGKLIDAATNWIVYGFPAIAGATAVVLVVAGIRLMARR
jgi:Gpi18-like mannosyltransferase